MKDQKKFKVKINDDYWDIRVLKDHDYISFVGGGAAATHGWSKQIVFKESLVSRETVWHEVVHAHCHYLYTSSAELTAADFEEMICDLFSEKWYDIYKISRKIIRKLEAISEREKVRHAETQIGAHSPDGHIKNRRCVYARGSKVR